VQTRRHHSIHGQPGKTEVTIFPDSRIHLSHFSLPIQKLTMAIARPKGWKDAQCCGKTDLHAVRHEKNKPHQANQSRGRMQAGTNKPPRSVANKVSVIPVL
jgi:hypothetical protein